MCDCAAKVKEAMKGSGSEIALTMPLDGSQPQPMLQVGREGEPWKKPLSKAPQFVVPSYCPFCGEKYERDE